jgi:hypothetical protein
LVRGSVSARFLLSPLADARQLAREALRDAALGEDPAKGKREARNGDYRRTLKAAVQASAISQQPAPQLARGELRAFLEGIARKTPIRANRVLALVRAAFRWGLREELIERDPTAGLQRLRPGRRGPDPGGSDGLARPKRLPDRQSASAAPLSACFRQRLSRDRSCEVTR